MSESARMLLSRDWTDTDRVHERRAAFAGDLVRSARLGVHGTTPGDLALHLGRDGAGFEP